MKYQKENWQFLSRKIRRRNVKKNHKNILKVVQIKLPKELDDEYDHRTYLGALMKLGLEREKIGDIITNSQGAEIIVKNEIFNFLIQNLSSLSRFEKAEIEEKSIEELTKKKLKNKR